MDLLEQLSGANVCVFGYNGAIANTPEEDIWDPSQSWTPFAAAVKLEVASTSAADVFTSGTGAWKVRLIGLDADYKIIVEDVNLNGQTAVTTLNSFLRLQGMEVLSAGTGGVNAGVITAADEVVTWTTGTPSDVTKIVNQIAVGINRSRSTIFTIPAVGIVYKMKQLYIANRAQICTFYLMTREFISGLWVYQQTWSLAANTFMDHWPAYEMFFKEKTDIKIRAAAATTGAIASVILSLDKVPA